jgi:uncharacterized protein (TIGR03435 family)
MRRLALAAWIVATATVSAQQTPPSTFEVATLKVNKSGSFGQSIRRMPGGRVSATNMPVRRLIEFIYQLQPFQVVEGPGWLETERVDLVAKLAGAPAFQAPGSPTDPYVLAMRALIVDRFRLKTHREMREQDIYALVMAKPGGAPGPALKTSADDCETLMAKVSRGEIPIPPQRGPNEIPLCGARGRPDSLMAGGVSMTEFGNFLAGRTGRMVVDRTGLTGRWDFKLTFAIDRSLLPPGADAPPPDPDAPSLFTAIQEQLGLKLESTKAPVDVLVIDSAEHLPEE